jgi:hypothetical protein
LRRISEELRADVPAASTASAVLAACGTEDTRRVVTALKELSGREEEDPDALEATGEDGGSAGHGVLD